MPVFNTIKSNQQEIDNLHGKYCEIIDQQEALQEETEVKNAELEKERLRLERGIHHFQERLDSLLSRQENQQKEMK